MVCCRMRGCRKRSGDPGIKLFSFPIKHPDICVEWGAACGDTEHDPSNWKSRRVCSDHFSPSDYEDGSRKLKKTAIPTVITHILRIELDQTTLDQNATIKIGEYTAKLIVKFTNQVNVAVADRVFVATTVGLDEESDMNSVTFPLPATMSSGMQVQLTGMRHKAAELRAKVSEFQNKSSIQRNEKLSLKSIHQKLIKRSRKIKRTLRSRVTNLQRKLLKYDTGLSKIFTPKQKLLLLQGRTQAKWTNEEIGKFISLRYKSNQYEYMRQLGYPFAASRTLRTWMQKICLPQGMLYPVINLLRNHFENEPPITKECVLVFDEMAIDSSVDYDAAEDRIYGPKNQLNAYFIRGLFNKWKQAIAYKFDDDFTPETILHMISTIEGIGLRVRAMVCDLGGRNRGLLKKLGVSVRKRKGPGGQDVLDVQHSFPNPARSLEQVYFFPCAPHLMKLLWKNFLKHGLCIDDGFWLLKSDLEQTLMCDIGELKANYKLRKRHLEPKGREKMCVRTAVQVFSNTTAAVYRKVFPNRPAQSNFIQLMNQWFDLMDSRHNTNALPGKKPFGIDLNAQLLLLDKVETAVKVLRVGQARHLYPFQRGMLQSIQSMKALFHEVSGSSLRISYILTHRLNQDMAENAFSLIRKAGAYHTKPTAIDAKHRFKRLILSWGGDNLRTSSVESEQNGPYLTAQMMKSLMDNDPTPPEDSHLVELDGTPIEARLLTTDDAEEIIQSMGIKQRLEFCGKEYVVGSEASKVAEEFPELRASEVDLAAFGPVSWVKELSQRNLTIPSLDWMNKCEVLGEEFESYHLVGDKYHLNKKPGVFKAFSDALRYKYEDIPEKALRKYIWTRLCIRMRSVNQQLIEERQAAAQRRTLMWSRRQLQEEGSDIEEDEEDEEDEEAVYVN